MSKGLPQSLEKFRRKPLITALEARVLLDGAAVATTVEMATDVDHQIGDTQATTESMVHFAAPAPTSSDNGQRREVAFVDRGVEGSQALADGLGDHVEVIYLDADSNGLEQMVAALEGRQDIDAVHVLSHGDVGELKLGSLTLDGNNLNEYASELETLGQSLSESGDLMLYGCYVGADAAGRNFIDAFAGLTGGDVAASEDLTGAGDLGGDWDLEVESGVVETSAFEVSDYAHVLVNTDFGLRLDSSSTWIRPTPGAVVSGDGSYGTFETVSSGSQTYNYAFVEFTPTATGDYDILVTQSDMSDPMVFLYGTGFDKNSPTSDFIVGDDDSGDDYGFGSSTYWPGLDNVTLQAGNTYHLVMSSYSPGDAGVIDFRISGPGSVTIDSGTLANQLPVASNGSGTTSENTVLNASVPVATDPDGSVVSYSLASSVSAGALSFNPDGSYTFDPGTAFDDLGVGQTRSVSFMYSAVDNEGAISSPATVEIVVTGTNDAPSFSTQATLSGVSEDTTSPIGDTVANLFADSFADPDTAANLSAIVVTADASDPAEGEWQYSSNGNDWYSIGNIAPDAGLVLASTASLRFVPAADYNGTPGSLSVHAVDSSDGSIAFTNGATRETFDTTAANATGGTSAVSANAVSLGTSVTSVNDPALITNSPVTITHTDTTANDSFTAVNGTITANDLHGSAPSESGTLSFGIVGGTFSNNESVLAGSYGSLTLNTLTGDYTWTPDSAAINSLPAGSRVSDTFTIRVSDGQGGQTDQTFTVNVDPANDAPVVTAPADINITDTSGATIVGNIVDTIQASDLDTGAALVFTIKSASGSVQSTNGQLGRLELDSATGQYTFTPDLAALNALDSDTTETFTLVVSDGTDTVETALNINVTAAQETAANYVEQGSAISVLDDTVIDTGLSYGGGYIDFDLDSSQGTETLGLQRVAQADTAAGAVSIVDNAVYLGDGTAARVIGQVDSTRNGLNGNPLRINFSVDFVNGSFEESSAGSVTSTLGEKVEITGWTVVNDRVTLGAEQHYDYVQNKWIDNTIAGLATPEDTTYPTNNLNRTRPDSSSIGSEATADNGGTNPYADGMQDYGNLDSQSYYSNIASGSVSNGGSGNSLQMGSRLNSEAGYEVIRGPYVHSTGTVSLEAGDEVAFSWKAEGGGDAYDVFGYIVNVNDASDYQVILDATGNSPRSQTAWAREAVSADSAGEYRFVFVSGTFDATGGEVLGAQLYIDDVEVQQQNPAGNIGSDVLQALARQVTFADSSDLSATNGTDSRVLKVTTATGGDSPDVHTSEKAIAIGEVNDPVALETPATTRYTDTAAIDSFVATSGQLQATDADAGTTFEFGLAGNDVTIENGLVTQTGAYGTLIVDPTTGEYTYTPDATKLNALVADATETFVVRVADGSGSSDEQTLTVELEAANDAPLLGGTTSTPVFVENGAPVQVDAGIIIADPEGLPFDGGSLTVSNTGNGESSDQLSVLALNGVSRNGADVSVGGVVVGRIDGHYNGQDGKALRIDLNGNANALQVQALARAIAFSNNTDTVSESTRDFRIEVSDGGGSDKPLYSTRSAHVAVQAINDLPEITLAAGAYVVEKVVGTNPDGRMDLTGLQISDADHEMLSVTIATSRYGSLTVLDNVPGGLSAAQISDNGSRSLTLTGTQAEINTTLAAAGALVYEAGSGNDIVTPGADYLQVTARDAANGETLASKQVTVVPAVPNADSAARVAAEDSVISVNLRDLVADINDNAGYYELGTGAADQTDGNDQVTTPGSLSAFDPARLIYADHDIDGDGDVDTSQAIGFRLDHGELILGNDEVLEQVNGNWRIPGDALANLTYTPDADWSGTEQFVYQYTSGDGNKQSHIAEVAFYVTAVNDAPVLDVPSAQTVNEDAPLVFSTAQGNGISLSDVDAQGDELALTLKVDRGTLSLSGDQGLTVLEGSNNSGQMMVKGTLSELQAALDGLSYTAMADYHGQDTLTVTLDDLGGSGDGGAAFTTEQVSLTVAPVNDAPQVGIVDVSGAVQEDLDTVADNPNTAGVEDGSYLVERGAITFGDVDLGDSSTVTWALNDGGIRYTSGVEGTPEFEAAIAHALRLSGDTQGQQSGTVNWQFALDNSLAQFLPEGGLAEADYTLTVTDSEGATVSTTVTLTIAGTNDAPVVTSSDASGVVTDGAVLNDSGTIEFTDADRVDRPTSTSAVKSVTAVRADGTTPLPLTASQRQAIEDAFALTADPANTNEGSVTWDYTIADSDLAFLADGEVVTAVFTVTVKDGNGGIETQDVSTTLTGGNADPEVVSADTNGTITDGVSLSDNGVIRFTDADLTDRPTASESTRSVTAVRADGTTPLTLTASQRQAIEDAFTLTADPANTNDGSVAWDYTIADSELAFLADGEVVTAVFTVTVDDGQGGKDSRDVAVTLTGDNEAPEVVAADDNGTIIDGFSLSDNGAIRFTDADLTDRPTVSESTRSVTAVRADGTTPLPLTAAQRQAIEDAFALTADPANTNEGSVTWDYTIADSDLVFLADGEVVTAVFTVTVEDGNGGTETQNVTVLLEGRNDVPVVTVNAPVDMTEQPDAAEQTLAQAGKVRFSDADLTDSVNISFASNNDITWKRSDGSLVNGLPEGLASDLVAGFDTGATGLTNTGEVDWTYQADDVDLDFLNAGDTLSFSYTVTAGDSQGTNASEVVRITLVGTNDAPEVAREMTRGDTLVQQGADYRVEVGSLFSDKDSALSGESLEYSVSGLPKGVSFDPVTNIISGKPAESGVFNIIVTAQDAEGSSFSRNYQLTVTAVVDSETGGETGDTPPPPAPETDFQPVDSGSSGLPDGLVSEVESGDPADSSGFVAPGPETEASEAPEVDSEIAEVDEEPVASDSRPGERVLIAEEGALVVQSQNPDGNTTTRASVDVNVGDDGQVVFSDIQREAFSTVSLSVASIGRTSDTTVEIDIEDTSPNAGSQQYSGSLAGGESLPSWIQVDPSTGSVTIDNPPADQSKVDLRIQALGSDGQVRILELKLDLEELLKRQSVDSQHAPEPVEGATGYRPLAEQLEAELATRNDYGNRLMAMLGA